MSIKRDENGYPIVPGKFTLQKITIRGGKRSGQKFYYKDRAEDRLIQLLKKGSEGDRMTKRVPLLDRSRVKHLEFQQELAMSSKAEQFAYYNKCLNDLIKELDDLEDSENIRKINLQKPVIESQIKEMEQKMLGVYKDLDEIQ